MNIESHLNQPCLEELKASSGNRAMELKKCNFLESPLVYDS